MKRFSERRRACQRWLFRGTSRAAICEANYHHPVRLGVSFAFLNVDIVPAIAFIGITTFAFSFAGVRIGKVFGARYKSKAEIAGGVILILIGTKILLQHLGFIKF